jgi:hypothetical protein
MLIFSIILLFPQYSTLKEKNHFVRLHFRIFKFTIAFPPRPDQNKVSEESPPSQYPFGA